MTEPISTITTTSEGTIPPLDDPNNNTNNDNNNNNNNNNPVDKPVRGGEAWGIDFSLPKMKRKTTKKERDAVTSSRLRQFLLQKQKQEEIEKQKQLKEGKENNNDNNTPNINPPTNSNNLTASTTIITTDSEGNRHLPIVSIDNMINIKDYYIPTSLSTTRSDLEKRLCLRLPRLLTLVKQYPRSCGISSLTSVWNYLYSRIGELNNNNNINSQAPISQEEIMSILGFAPPFDEIAWGPFTGNETLIRWFHALNKHFGVKGKAYIFYKPQGKTRTTCTSSEALTTLKELLQNPHAAVIYHCHNHYMVPIGYQDIPRAQTDFYAKEVSENDCETTIYIGEVSRGRHEAMYARRWSEIVKDLMCRSPQFYNIRRPELGIQTRVSKKKKILSDEGVNETQEGQIEKKKKKEEEDQSEINSKGAVSLGNIIEETQLTSPGINNNINNNKENNEVVETGEGKKKKKSSGGNLHCLICFRCDEFEEQPERFENPSSTSRSNSNNTSSGGSGDESEE